MRAARLILLLLAGGGMMGAAHGADDDYLKALQAETQSLSSGETATVAPAAAAAKPQQAWSAAGQGLGEGLPPNLSQEQFEAALKSSYFGTFMFYSKLKEQDKGAVYQAYQSNGQIDHIRETTTSLLKK